MLKEGGVYETQRSKYLGFRRPERDVKWDEE